MKEIQIEYPNHWLVEDLATGERAICPADYVFDILYDFTNPWNCHIKGVAVQIWDSIEIISSQCRSGKKQADFEAHCAFLNVRVTRLPESMTAEDYYELMMC